MAQIESSIAALTNQDIEKGLEAMKTANKGGEFLAKWAIEIDPDFIRKTLVPKMSPWDRIDLSTKGSSHTTGHLHLEAMFYIVNNGTLDPTLDKAKSLFKRSVHVEKQVPAIERSLWHHRSAFNHYKLLILALVQKRDTVSTAEILKITQRIPYFFSIASILPDNASKLLNYFAALERILRTAAIEKSTQVLSMIASKTEELGLLTEPQKKEYKEILNDPTRKRSVNWIQARTDTQTEKKDMIATLMTENLVPELRTFLRRLDLPVNLKKIFDQNEAHFAAIDGIYSQLSESYRKTKLDKPCQSYFHWMMGLLYVAPGISIYDPDKAIKAFRAGALLGDLRCQVDYIKTFAEKIKAGGERDTLLCQEAYDWNKRLLNSALQTYIDIYLNLEESTANPEEKLRHEWLNLVYSAAINHHTLVFMPPISSEESKIEAVNLAIAKLEHLSEEYGHLQSITYLMKHNLALAAAGIITPENVVQQFVTYATAARLIAQNPNADLSLKLSLIKDIQLFQSQYAAFVPDEANYHFGWILNPHYYQNFLAQLQSPETEFTPENIEDYNGAIYQFVKDPFLDDRIPGVKPMKMALIATAAAKLNFKITENIDDLNQNKMISNYLYQAVSDPLAKTSATLNVQSVISIVRLLHYIGPAAMEVYGAALSLEQQALSRQLQLIAPMLEQAPDDQALQQQAAQLTIAVTENNQKMQHFIKMTRPVQKAPSE